MASRDIPEDVAREVRQRCGFGCVICGLPLYEYEHLEGFATVHRHLADEMTLLCNLHHAERTKRLLTLDAVRAANDNPHNRRNGVSTPYDLHYTGSACRVRLGSMTFAADVGAAGAALIPVTIDENAPIWFAFEDGHYLLNAKLFDVNDQVILRITNNQLVYSVLPWDITFVGRTLILREAKRRILLEISFQLPNEIVIDRAVFRYKGVTVVVSSGLLGIVNTRNAFANFTISAGSIPSRVSLIAVGDPPDSMQWLLNVPVRQGQRRAISRQESLAFVRAQAKQIRETLAHVERDATAAEIIAASRTLSE